MIVGPAQRDHIPLLLERLGPERIAAIAARVGGDAAGAILGNLPVSTLTWCGTDNEGVVVLGGVIPIDPDAMAYAPGSRVGYVWQFLTDAVRTNKRGYLLMSRTMLRRGMAEYDRLVMAIETEYTAALRHIGRQGGRVFGTREIAGQMTYLCEVRP